MDSKLHAYTDVRNAIRRMLESGNVTRGSSTEHSLCILEQKWTTVYGKVQDRKVRVILRLLPDLCALANPSDHCQPYIQGCVD